VELDVGIAPDLFKEAQFKGARCAVIDVLRASTTIITALASGGTEVHLCMDATEARRYAESLGDKPYLLGGEEKGHRIPGFHLGNSPLEYSTPEVVAGKVIFFSTTNGTPVMRKAYTLSGFPVYIVALLNVSAVSSALVRAVIDGSLAKILLLCSGNCGGLSAEDLLCAGLVARKVRNGLLQAGISCELSDDALIASGFAAESEGRVFEVLTASEHGRYLQSIGYAADLELAGQMDAYDIVPVFDGNHVAPQLEM